MKTLCKTVLFFALIFSAIAILAQNAERERGIALYKQGNYSQAVAVLEIVSKQKDLKNDAQVWNYLGLAYIENREFKNAGKALEKAVKLDPQNSDYRTNLAFAYLLIRKVNNAQSEIAEAIQLNPRNISAYYLRGTARLWEGKIDEAIVDVDEMIRINPKYEPAYALKSDTLLAVFGRNVLNGSTGRAERGYLQEAIRVLEYCTKNCEADLGLAGVRDRLGTVEAFDDYFSRAKSENENRTPIKILDKTPAVYTDKARSANVSGDIRLYVLFAANGIISHIIVLNRLGYGLDEEAVRAAKRIVFEPATENGKPVPSVKQVVYRFTLY